MTRPSRMVYNELDGEEVRHVLEQRVRDMLGDVSFLQRHLTLPRVRMSIEIHLDVWADQPTPERHTITENVEVETSNYFGPAAPTAQISLSETVNAAPGGQPPDKIREDYALPVPTPVRGPITVEDQKVGADIIEGRRITTTNGVVIDRTGRAPERSHSTVIVQDWGVAGLAHGQMNRPEMPLRGGRDGEPVAPPRLPPKERE